MADSLMRIVILVLMVHTLQLVLGNKDSVHWELKLYKDLMVNYDKNIRPVRNPDTQLTASLLFSLARVESLDEKAQVLTTFGWMQVVGRGDQIIAVGSEDFVFPMVAMQLKLKRRPTFLVLNLIVPALIMTLMALLVFCLPVEAGEKISLGITVLLSYSVVLLMVSDITPRVSDTVPLLSVYIFISMGMTGLALFSTVLVLSVHHHSPDKPVPTWLHTSILRVHAFLLCMRRHRDVPSSDGDKWGNKVQPMTSDVHSVEDVATDDSHMKEPAVISDVVKLLRAQEAERTEQKRNEDNQGDWEAVARMIDRFFLVFYGVTIIITSAIIMGVLASNDANGFMEGVLYIVS